MAVQLQTGVADVDFVQPPLDHVERRHLLGDEQHLPVVGHGLGDQVRDGLRLAGSRWSLNDEVAAVLDVDDGEGLGTVGIDDMVRVGDTEMIVEMVVFGDGRVRLPEPVFPEQGPNDGMIAWPLALGPRRGIEILVDEQLVEGEEAEVDRAIVDRPPISPALTAALVFSKYSSTSMSSTSGRSGRRKTEILREFRLQREVGGDLVLGEAQGESRSRIRPAQRRRDQYQRRRGACRCSKRIRTTGASPRRDRGC